MLVLPQIGNASNGESRFLLEQAQPATQEKVDKTSTSGIRITDALGRTVTLSQLPQRIIVGGKVSFILIDALYMFPEAVTRMAALSKTLQDRVGFISLVEPGLASKTILESESGPEALLAAKPDLILMKSVNAEKFGKPLEKLGIPVIYLNLETPEAFFRDVKIIGQIMGASERADEICKLFADKQEAITKKSATIPEEKKPRVLIVSSGSRDGSAAFSVPPASWIQTTMVRMAGGRPAWLNTPAGDGWSKVGFEQIAAWDPDIVCVISYFSNVDEALAKLVQATGWKELRAVREGRLYAFPGDYISWDQPDPRWILGLTWLAKTILPQEFKEINPREEARSFFEKMYGIDAKRFEEAVAPQLKGSLQ